MDSFIEYLHSLRLIADSGLVVLIWMVQLIVYPGFKFYNTEDLIRWHKVYTPRITVIVAPLMFFQAGIATYLLLFEFSTISLIYFILVLSTWVSTFLYFVPLHHKIDTQIEVKLSATELTRRNWYRTFQWTSIFIYGIILFS